jgi:hypothetical protein
MTVLKFGRRAVCEVCSSIFFDELVGGPHCCPQCETEIEAEMCEEIEAEARAKGFASFDAWAEAGYPETIKSA